MQIFTLSAKKHPFIRNYRYSDCTVYQDGWELIANGETAPWGLYNLANAPIEQRDLTNSFLNMRI